MVDEGCKDWVICSRVKVCYSSEAQWHFALRVTPCYCNPYANHACMHRQRAVGPLPTACTLSLAARHRMEHYGHQKVTVWGHTIVFYTWSVVVASYG